MGNDPRQNISDLDNLNTKSTRYSKEIGKILSVLVIAILVAVSPGLSIEALAVVKAIMSCGPFTLSSGFPVNYWKLYTGHNCKNRHHNHCRQ
jgi:hypothetical protein